MLDKQVFLESLWSAVKWVILILGGCVCAFAWVAMICYFGDHHHYFCFGVSIFISLVGLVTYALYRDTMNERANEQRRKNNPYWGRGL